MDPDSSPCSSGINSTYGIPAPNQISALPNRLLAQNNNNNTVISKRRKKKPNFNLLKTVQIERGPPGYGFTIAGSSPCYLNCVLRGSAAESAGLQTGQFIMTVNGENVSHWSTGEVVDLIMKCPGMLTLNLAHDDDDSIDEDDVIRCKPRRPIKNGQQNPTTNTASRAEKATEEILAGSIFTSFFSSDGGSGSNSTSVTSRNRGYVTSVNSVNSVNSMASTASSGSSNSHILPITHKPGYQTHQQVPVNSGAESKSSLRHLNSSNDITSAVVSGYYYSVVGYVGSVEIPSQSFDHTTMIHTIQGCVRRLQVEKKVNVMLLLEISEKSIRLINSKNITVVTIQISSILLCNVSDDDRRFFGLVARNQDDPSNVTTSCLVFMVDPQISFHSVHLKAARKFSLACSRITSNLCKEFPSDSVELVNNLQTQVSKHQLRHFTPSPDQHGCQSIGSNSDSGIVLCKDKLCKFCTENSHRIFNPPPPPTHPLTVKSSRGISPANRIHNWGSGDVMTSGTVTSSGGGAGHVTGTMTSLSSATNGYDRAPLTSTPVDSRLNPRALTNTPHESMYHHNTPYDGRGSGPGGLYERVSSEHRPASASPASYEEERYRCNSALPSVSHQQHQHQRPVSSASELHINYPARSGSVPPTQYTDTNTLSKVASWAATFDNLLSDSYGISMFTEFLKKEFAEENIMFWQSCQLFKTISDPSEREELAFNIFHQHLASNCTHPVNIDNQVLLSVSEKLQKNVINQDLFKDAELQIYNLMKFDPYSRFLKSDLYKSNITAEFASPSKLTQMQRNSQSLSIINESNPGAAGQQTQNEDSAHDNSGNQEQPTAKRSLLPWKKKKSLKSESSDASLKSLEKSLDKCKGISQSSESLLSMPNSSFETNQCKVLLPNGCPVVMNCDVTHSVGYSLNMLCMQYNLKLKFLDILLREPQRQVNINEPVRSLAGKEIFLERRVYFKLELPSTQVVGVKSKPNISIRDVFQPLLVKYRLSLNNLVIRLADQSTPLNLQLAVAMLDQKKVIAETIEQYAQNTIDKENKTTYSRPSTSSTRSSHMQQQMQMQQQQPQVQSVHKTGNRGSSGSAGSETRRASNEEHQFYSSHQDNTDTALHHRHDNTETNKADTTLESGQLFGLLSKIQGNRIDSQRGIMSLSKLDMPSFLDHRGNQQAVYQNYQQSCQSPSDKFANEFSFSISDQPLQSTMIQHKPPSGKSRNSSSKHPIEPPMMVTKTLRKEITPIPSNFGLKNQQIQNQNQQNHFHTSSDSSSTYDIGTSELPSPPASAETYHINCPNPSMADTSIESVSSGTRLVHINPHRDDSTVFKTTTTEWVDQSSTDSNQNHTYLGSQYGSSGVIGSRYGSSDNQHSSGAGEPPLYPSAASSASSLGGTPNQLVNIYHV